MTSESFESTCSGPLLLTSVLPSMGDCDAFSLPATGSPSLRLVLLMLRSFEAGRQF